jgi:hypothetical protein
MPSGVVGSATTVAPPCAIVTTPPAVIRKAGEVRGFVGKAEERLQRGEIGL